MNLEDLGWDAFFEAQLAAAPGLRPARITAEYGGCYGVETATGPALASLSGHMKHNSSTAEEMPVVGDWVFLADAPGADRLPIRSVLKRKSKLSRKATDKEEAEQPIAANADTVFIVQGLDANYNPRRLERYLIAVGQSGAAPAVILNKADLCPNAAALAAETAALAPGVPVLLLDSVSKLGYDALLPFLGKGRTLAFIGSSGVGKSTIINNLGAAPQKTGEVKAKDLKGMHTTTTRRLLALAGGALLIDTPGMKEFAAWEPKELGDTFPEIAELALDCRFTDCLHETEPGCAVRAALDEGRITAARYAAFAKIKKEAFHQRARLDAAARLKKKADEKKISKAIKNLYKNRKGGKR